MDVISEAGKKLRIQYLNAFDSNSYKNAYFSKVDGQKEFMMTSYFDSFKTLSNKKEIRLLDFGCGSTPVYASIPIAVGIPVKTVMSEFLPQNRELLLKWINKENDAPSFDPFFQFISKLSGKSVDELTEKTRESIQKIESYDLHEDFSRDNGKYDVIISTFCIDCSITSDDEFEHCLKKVVDLLDKDGIFMTIGGLSFENYKVGKEEFGLHSLSVGTLTKIAEKVGLKILRLRVDSRDIFSNVVPSKMEGVYFIMGKKI